MVEKLLAWAPADICSWLYSDQRRIEAGVDHRQHYRRVLEILRYYRELNIVFPDAERRHLVSRRCAR